MDDSPRSNGSENAKGIRRQLIARGAVAVALIVALLAALALFQRNQSSEPSEPAPVAKTITPIGPSLSSPSPADSQSPSLADAATDAVKQSSDAPEVSGTALSDTSSPPAEPEESAEPTVAPSPVKKTRPTSKAPHLVVEQSAAKTPPQVAKPVPAPAAQPASRPETPPNSAGYVVQLGVFSNTANAEELRTRLTENGIPSHLETRVQLGPFNTRQEALAAQDRLRKLGMAPGMVVATKK
ncbi:MAG TPA: SPOR domain-containing protein [Rhodocyclaceae bacterium]|nr:SPOR domain-containing protein [Rhodocyclaceae bacterium]